jgi:hypothetical protein
VATSRGSLPFCPKQVLENWQKIMQINADENYLISFFFFFDINRNEKFISDENYDRIVPTKIFDRNSNSIEKIKKILKIH